MVSLSNGTGGRRNGGYAFDDDDSNDSDKDGDHTPLLASQHSESSSASRHLHIITGYLSAIEVVLLLVYTGTLLVFTITNEPDTNNTTTSDDPQASLEPTDDIKKLLVTMFCIGHTLLWLIVFIMDRFVQWRHQVMRRMGYLKFYRRMRNIRRIPFLVASLTNAVLLVFVCLLYKFNVTGRNQFLGPLDSTYTLYIIIGLEMLLAIPCLIYYIIQATWFNCVGQPPDVIRETASVSNSPTNTLTTVGFREGEDLDELLERQADMIRYLQQHNASLGRRIMELQQSRTLE